MSAVWSAERLMALLPALYRVRDEEAGGALRELLEVVANEVAVLAESLERSYDDLFIETCAGWVAPYIGDLIGYRPLYGVVPGVASPRAEVANTIRLRRRKGTAAMLEQLARDVTGWHARAVEYFERLATTQYMNHVRPHAAATADLRDPGRLEWVGTAFDDLAHTAEMRRAATRAGRHNIPNVGIFLWRAEALRTVRAPLVAADAGGRRFRIDPLGTDVGLFALPRTEDEVTHIAEPLDVPLPLTRRALGAHLAELYGPGRSLLLETEPAGGGEPAPVPVAAIRVCDLSDDPTQPGTWAHEPGPGATHVALDPVLGRVAFPAPSAAGETRLASFAHGAALRVGGGGYARPVATDGLATVQTAAGGQALAPLVAAVAGGGGVRIGDSRRYAAPATVAATTPVAGAGDRSVVLAAADRARPLLAAAGPVRLTMEPDTTVVLDGLTLAGGALVMEEAADTRPRTLVLRHCTLVPGLSRTPAGDPAQATAAALIVLHPFASVTLEACVVGPIVAVEGAEVIATDTILDAGGPAEVALCGRAAPAGGGLRVVEDAADRLTGDGLAPAGALRLDACTVIGRMHAARMDVSDSLLLAEAPAAPGGWPAPVWAERRQVGCMRFSYVPLAARTPRRFHCVPDAAAPGVRPHHTSLRLGDPGYGQLRRGTPDAIRTGSSAGGEMGATHGLHAPQREANLLIRLDEYLRFGLEAGVVFAT